MRELPSPVFPITPQVAPRPVTPSQPVAGDVLRNLSDIPVPLAGAPVAGDLTDGALRPADQTLQVCWARNLDEVREAQRLRYQVFAGEMGARLMTPVPGHDIDLFDDYCEHLLIRAGVDGPVVGTYRVLTPAQARRVGGTYSDTEFDLVRLRGVRERMVELGRSCVHPEYRSGGVIMALWGALAGFMVRNHLDTMIGCASIPMVHGGVVSGDAAASIWRQLRDTRLAPLELQVWPRLPLPLERLDDTLHIEPPALIRGYLRMGAKVLGAPAWDPDFNTADVPMLMRIADLPSRYRKHFLG